MAGSVNITNGCNMSLTDLNNKENTLRALIALSAFTQVI